jgi:hypothetical protein
VLLAYKPSSWVRVAVNPVKPDPIGNAKRGLCHTFVHWTWTTD